MKTLKQLMDLKGRVALITGGAGHIGSVIAETYAELGASVVLLDRDDAQSTHHVKHLEKEYSVKAASLVVDLEQEKQLKSVPTHVHKLFGRLDILVHAAALVGTSQLPGWNVPFEEQSVATWRRALEINLTSVFSVTQALTPMLSASGHGSIITIGSIHALGGPHMHLYEGTPMGNPAAYGVSKAGLLQLTRWLSSVMAPAVRANMITLGGVLRGHTDPFLSRYKERTPMQRMATEEDVKGAAAYLASDASAYVTGHNLIVDGGWTAW